MEIVKTTKTDIQNLLDACEGLHITVCLTAGDETIRDTFQSQISIEGTLEAKSETEFRIVVSNGSFTYFGAPECRVAIDRREAISLDGSHAVIFLDPAAFIS